MASKPVSHPRIPAVLITPDGSCLRENSRAFLALVGEPVPDWDAARFAVVNLGFVALRRVGAAFEVCVHPRTADPAAIDAAIALMGTSGAPVLAIAWLAGSSWKRETFASARDACVRLMDLCAGEERCVGKTEAFPAAVAPAFCRS